MKIKNESFENVKKALESDEIETGAHLSLIMKDAYKDSVRASAHLADVKKELEDKAKCIVTDSPDTGKEIKNVYTKRLKLDESIEDFDVNGVNH